MRFGIIFYGIIMIIVSSMGQTIDLSGKVVNTSGEAVEGAIVTLAGKLISDTTKADGNYALFKQDNTAAEIVVIPNNEKITMSKGIITLCMPEPAPMRIDIFDVKGNVLECVKRTRASAGIYNFDILARRRTPQMMLVRASIGNRVATFRYLPLRQQLHVVNVKDAAVSTDNTALSKQLAEIDSLKVSAEGYGNKVIPISSYTGNNDITLEATLPYFSFFVTSYESIVEVSGSNDGFGGDLRFGETGAGAGIRGADKICETIAEMSMPGAKVKQWRAFLSASADENGNVVNARDRIGNGPWYDRKGRVLAPTLDDLINERPQNGDAAIRDDLPNEFGIPNHRPDPEAGDEDNHHMLTGSDSIGNLLTNATCEDWTTAEESTGARCGLAWPRFSGGMFKQQWGGGGGFVMENSHWISAFNAPGCKPGTDLDGSSMGGNPGDDFVGSGGGYGGFYCFALTP